MVCTDSCYRVHPRVSRGNLGHLRVVKRCNRQAKSSQIVVRVVGGSGFQVELGLNADADAVLWGFGIYGSSP